MKRLFSASIIVSLICASASFGQIPITVSRVVDAASFSTMLAPGNLAIVGGSNFGSDTSIPVTVAGRACAVLSASPTQLQIQIAVDAPLGPTSLQVGNSAPFNISLSQYAPVMVSADGTGQGNVQASHGNGTPVTTSSPAVADEVIVISAIGLGPTVPVVPAGTNSPSLPPAFITTEVQINVAGTAQTALLFAGLAPGKVGVYQINFIMPPDIATGAQPIYISVGGVASNILALPSSDAPVISGLKNNYSYIAAGLPNYGIAQGAIFAIYGANLAKTSTPLQTAYPLHTSLAGVSISVMVNGTTTQPILYYASPNQLGAILPSSTPVGTGQITVTKNGQTGPPAPIQVVQSAVGLLTLNQAGSGPAAASDAKFNYLGFTNSVHVGEYVNFWGSGVGPAEGDETNPQTPAELVNIPIEVDIGGISAKVTYHGRTVYPGLDQIQAIVPDGVQPGCNVSVAVRTGSVVSNFATIPVAVGGRTCSEPGLGITSDQLQGVLSKPSFTFSTISINKDVSISQSTNGAGAPNSSSFSDRASAQFSRVQPVQFDGIQSPSVGSCIVYYNGYSFGVFNNGPLDAGPAINLSGPSAKLRLDPSGDDDGRYYEFMGDSATLPIFIPDSGGTFNIDNGPGGPDVGAFTASLALGTPLVWTNAASINTVNRSNGVTVTWTGGAPNSYVQISGTSVAAIGMSSINLAPILGVESLNASFSCAAPVAAGQFTIPAAVLLALLPTAPDVNPLPTLSVGSVTNGPVFTGPGLDLGIVSANVNSSIVVTYK